MTYTYVTKKQYLYLVLHGELDHHTAKSVRTEIDALLDAEKPKIFVFDLSEIVFCDSSGLGIIMGRFKKMMSLGGEMIVLNPSEAVNKIMELAGMDKLIKIERGEKISE